MYVAPFPIVIPPTGHIRESKWVHGKTVKTTLAHITQLPTEVILDIRQRLKGGPVIHEVH